MQISTASINALLPQTQCTRCGFQGCMPYAQAITNGAPINQCPPGGQALIAGLAALLGQAELPLNPEHGIEAPRRLALIDESECIGCTKCIQVCPTDAIVGASKLMHTVIHAECVSCDLCVPACPVDCISMQPDYLGNDAQPRGQFTAEESNSARSRYEARNSRLARQSAEKSATQAAKLAQLRAKL